MGDLNIWAILGVTIGTFFFGAFWFSVPFAKAWMKIHHGDKEFSKEEMKEMEKGMWKLMLSEFIATLLITVGFACIVNNIPQYSGMHLALLVWLGFILPVTISNVIWGNDQKKYMIQKVLISTSYRLLVLVIAGYVFSNWL
jgi:F0F1-type ATP synthase assembly protein I